jgi:hypothetical protein
MCGTARRVVPFASFRSPSSRRSASISAYLLFDYRLEVIDELPVGAVVGADDGAVSVIAGLAGCLQVSRGRVARLSNSSS